MMSLAEASKLQLLILFLPKSLPNSREIKFITIFTFIISNEEDQKDENHESLQNPRINFINRSDFGAF